MGRELDGYKDFQDWNQNNKSPLVSDHVTSSERIKDNQGVSWNNYSGTKQSHDVTVNQYNIKDPKTGAHLFYNFKTGRGGISDKHK